MKKVFVVNEYEMGCCDLEASQIRIYDDKESAELYAKEMNETEEALEFIDCYDYLGIKYKYRVHEQEVYNKHTEKVYQVTWFNGEMFFEMQERKIMGIFSTMEKAQSYIDKWRENYVKESEEFAIKHNYHQYDDYEFEHYFPEEMWITEYEII